MGRRLRYGNATASIELDDFATDILTRVIDEGFPTVRRRIGSTTQELWEDAREDWPVKTGRSKAALDWAMRIETDAIVGTVSNSARKDGFPYAYSIRTPDFKGSERVWDILVRDPAEERMERMAEDLAPVLGQTAVGGG